jgi:hypothetical protein
MLILEDIIYKSNIFYNNKSKLFEDITSNDTIESSETSEIIEEPVIIIQTLNSCFSHAILDSCFSIFWVIEDLISNNYIKNENIKIFIKKENILFYPKQNLPLIDKDNKIYKGVFKNIIELLTDKPIIFEHLINNNIIFKQCFFYPDDDKWQRTPWNCVEYYPGRDIKKQNIRFNDEIIYDKLYKFRTKVIKNILNPYDNITKDNKKNLIIIDRKYNRKFDNNMIDSIKQEADKNTKWIFNGIFYLEDLSFYEQVELFNKTHYYILRHGSAAINLLWTQQNSFVFELMGGNEGINTSPIMYERICKLTNTKIFSLNYDKYNIKKDIFDNLNILINN